MSVPPGSPEWLESTLNVTPGRNPLKLVPLVNRGLTSFPRGESLQSYVGGYGLYYRSPMVDLGLVAPRGTPFTDTEGATTKVDVPWPGAWSPVEAVRWQVAFATTPEEADPG